MWIPMDGSPTAEGLQEAVYRSKYLLKQFGFPEFGDLAKTDTQEVAQTLACIDALIASRQREMAQRSELFERIHTSEREKACLYAEVERAKYEIERLQSELSQHELQFRTHEQRWNKERKLVYDDRNKLQVELKKQQSKEVQTQHEMRQLSQQLTKYQETLRKTLGEKDLVVKNPLELTNVLQGSLPQIAESGGFVEFTRIIVNGYAELRKIRDDVQRLNTEISELLNASNSLLVTRQMPAETYADTVSSLYRLASQLSAANPVDIDRLEKDLQHWKCLAGNQYRLIAALNIDTEVIEDEEKAK